MWSRLFRRRATLRESIVAEVLSHVAEANKELKFEAMSRADAVATLAQIKETEYRNLTEAKITALLEIIDKGFTSARQCIEANNTRIDILRSEVDQLRDTLYSRTDGPAANTHPQIYFSSANVTELHNEFCGIQTWAKELNVEINRLKQEVTQLNRRLKPEAQ